MSRRYYSLTAHEVGTVFAGAFCSGFLLMVGVFSGSFANIYPPLWAMCAFSLAGSAYMAWAAWHGFVMVKRETRFDTDEDQAR